MLEALRARLAYQSAVKAAARRPVEGGAVRARDAVVLVLLPRAEEDVRVAWQLVRAIEAPRRQILPVGLHGRVPYVPDAFAGGVHQIEDRQLDWRGLPTPAVSRAIWARQPRVALDLSASFDLAAAYLVGASPATLRVGLHHPRGEPFYDFLVAPTHGYRVAIRALRRYLAALDPPVLAFND